MESKVSIVKCNSYDAALIFTKKAVQLLGGISAFVKPQSRVLVKPNLLLAMGPQYAITTHPEIVRAVIQMLKEIDCRVFVGDGPSVWGEQAVDVHRVYEETGIKEACAKEGAELVVFDKGRWRGKFPLTAWLDNCDYLISLPKFKTHELTILTAAIKNLYGLVTGVYKTELHKKYYASKEFAGILVDIYQEARPALTIVDAILAMEGDGPGTSGSLRDADFIIAGSDCLAIDSILALVMGLRPEDIPTNKEAKDRGLGRADLNSIGILGDGLEDIISTPFKLPKATLKKHIPRPLIELVKKFICFYPQLNHAACIRCQNCVKVCPEKIIRLKKGRIKIDYRRCISCFCCQESCPKSAISVKKSVLARALGL